MRYPGFWVRTCLFLSLAGLLSCLHSGDAVPSKVLASQASEATRLEPTLSVSKDTKYVSCWDKKRESTVSRLVRSPILTAPDGLHRAYVEVEAIAFKPKQPDTYTGNLCENTSRLLLSEPGDANFKLVYSQTLDLSDGNSLKLVDWSPDSKYLLMERTTWKYESEGDYSDFVVFNVASQSPLSPDLYKMFERQFGRECGSENSVVGFTPQGKVVVVVAPLDDTYYNEGAISCVQQKTSLGFDLASSLQNIEILPASFTPQRYARYARENEVRK